MHSNNDIEIQIYKGRQFSAKLNYKKVPVVIAFDIDAMWRHP